MGNLYDFHDLQPRSADVPYLPPEAMYIHDVPIESRIPGYQTLNVTGRELLGYETDSTKVALRDGEIYNSAQKPTRAITVKYKLKSESDTAFREDYDFLQSLLNEKQFAFYFADDPLWEWTGTMTDAQIPPEGTNEVVATFTITCFDPAKHRRVPVVLTSMGSIKIREPLYRECVPDTITLTMESAATEATVDCGSLHMRIFGGLKAGDEVIIKPRAVPAEVWYNGALHLEMHDYMTDLENFAVNTGDVITVTPADTTIKLEMRSERG